ncbi:MAG: hypothetical protein C0436_03575 [Alphaproteobacteria bacterium]|nr:hypothetical protein [Alphaproteobacteria bacterium]
MTHGLNEHAPDAASASEALRNTLIAQAARLSELERELHGFLAEYYRAVAQDIEALFALENVKSSWVKERMPTAQTMQQQQESEAANARTQLAREAYRKAAKHTHPDTLEGGSHEDIQRINRAKEEGDIATLLGAALPQHHAAMDELVAWQTRLDDATRALLESPAYALYLKAFEARLAGRNWLEDMTHHIRKSIAIESRAIAKQGVKAIAEWRVA